MPSGKLIAWIAGTSLVTMLAVERYRMAKGHK